MQKIKEVGIRKIIPFWLLCPLFGCVGLQSYQPVPEDMIYVPKRSPRGVGGGAVISVYSSEGIYSPHPFYIEKSDTTRAEYEEFLDATGYSKEQLSTSEVFTEAVTGIRKEDALAYAEWRGRRLPNEWEWKQARLSLTSLGPYPWRNGEEFSTYGFRCILYEEDLRKNNARAVMDE